MDFFCFVLFFLFSHQMHKTVTNHPEMFAKLIMKGRQHLLLLAGQELGVYPCSGYYAHVTVANTNVFEQARLSHAFFHQNARAIQNQFSLSGSQAKDIIMTCPECQKESLSSTASSVNPRGLTSSKLWQSDGHSLCCIWNIKICTCVC